MTKSRQRGVLLDSVKVESYASQINATNITALHNLFLERYPDVSHDSKTIVDAWKGEKNIDKNKAAMLATLFGLESYQLLLPDNIKSCAWSDLLNNKNYQEKFMRFIERDDSGLQMVKIKHANTANLPTIALKNDWYLELQGKQHDFVFIILCADAGFFQLAPIEGSGFANQFTSDNMRYPQDNDLNFDDAYGKGWRQLIAIRARHMNCQIKNENTTYRCTLEELNQFSRRLEGMPNNDIAVDRYEFMLVD